MVLAMGWRKMRARGYAKNEARGRWREDGGAGACVVPKNAKAFLRDGIKVACKKRARVACKRG